MAASSGTRTMTSTQPKDQQEPETTPAPKVRLRSACDQCHESKVKCSGGSPCVVCEKASTECKYSLAKSFGRPRGVKNKKTRQRLAEAEEARRRELVSSHSQSSASHSSPDTGYSSIHAMHNMQSIDFGVNSCMTFDNSLPIPTTSATDTDFYYANPTQQPFFGADPSHIMAATMAPGFSALHSLDTFSVPDTMSLQSPITGQQLMPPPASTCNCSLILGAELVQLQANAREQPNFSNVNLALETSLATWQQHLHCQSCQSHPDEYMLTMLAMQFHIVIEMLDKLGQGASPGVTPDDSPELQAQVDSLVRYKLTSMAEVVRAAKVQLGAIPGFDTENRDTMPEPTGSAFVNYEAMDNQLQDVLGRIYKNQVRLMVSKSTQISSDS